MNRGIEAADADWIAILNNDVTLEPDWLAKLLTRPRREQAWFATGKILQRRRSLPASTAPSTRSRAAPAPAAADPGKPDWPVVEPASADPDRSHDRGAVPRASCFDESGRWTRRFESYLEDVDFGLRCALAGREGVYVPAAVAYHRGSATLGQWNKDTVRLIARNQVLLTAKHFRG